MSTVESRATVSVVVEGGNVVVRVPGKLVDMGLVVDEDRAARLALALLEGVGQLREARGEKGSKTGVGW